jgi:superfamily II DNA/RNA helicase
MDAFVTHQQVVKNYRDYLSSFHNIQDARIKDEVSRAFSSTGFIPEPLIQFNPSFRKGESLEDLCNSGIIHKGLVKTIGNYQLFHHQVEAIKLGLQPKGFVVTSGTGSGKSLTFLATIFDSIFKAGAGKKEGIKAILVYPMNALINSQEEEINKYAENFGEGFPVTAKKYTGQEGEEERRKIKDNPPDIILTNYMMLELIMTRKSEAWLRESLKDNLKYLVFDELHTYRGRQGSDVSLLIRRIHGWCTNELICIGTSATMASEGSPIEKRKKVAEVASTIFGVPFDYEQVINEQLETCTEGKSFNPFELKRALETEVDQTADVDAFRVHPLTNWLETEVALRMNEGVLERGKPLTMEGIAEKLRLVTELDLGLIKDKLEKVLRWTEQLNESNRTKGLRLQLLPFRFHQFISQTSTLSVTLEPRSSRKITILPGRYIKDDSEEKLLYPVLFSRYSGVDFLCVKKDTKGRMLLPRNPSDPIKFLLVSDAKAGKLVEENFADGYIIFDDGEEFWAQDFLDLVPPDWLDKNEANLKPFYEWVMPAPIYFNSRGEYSENPDYPLKGYYIPAPLRFDPTAGIIYDESKTKESTKLMSLGNEGRSTATTILAFSIINSLFAQNEKTENQKLLSFTDNRQDASLQAGHFNDFLVSVRLRSAIHHALKKYPDGLNVHDIAERVFEALKLKESAFAKEPSKDERWPDKFNLLAIKHYLLYRIFQDLERGWRYTLPNLEQTALIKIGYERLESVCEADDLFEKVEFFSNLKPADRFEILTQFLTYFRTNFAISHRILLEEKSMVENTLKDKLDSRKLWSLDWNEYMQSPVYMVTSSAGKNYAKNLTFASMGSRSGIGKFIKRKMIKHGHSIPKSDEFRIMMEKLCGVLTIPGILAEPVPIPIDGGTINGFLLRADCLIWTPGDEKTVPIDESRLNTSRKIELQPNGFFQNLYKTDFTVFNKEILGREHTGQLSSADRIVREGEFRKGEISSLFCSPTMELGIDIANLNIVHMRNVPPNPANYAQRSGRAGRSGQTAVVFTYCSGTSPHDQNYFKASHTMVAGSVAAPRIDLKNEELLTSHFNAFILMDLALQDLHTSVAAMLDLNDEKKIRVKSSVDAAIENAVNLHSERWIAGFRAAINKLEPELKDTWWFSDNWFQQKVASFRERFHGAFDRWISMYRTAHTLLNTSHSVVKDPTIKSDSPQKKEAKSQYDIALRQIKLLRNDSNSTYSNESEFYIFRYLASEGFLPGYNFTRLPIRAFVGFRHSEDGEYISRPRAVALKEFGPQNIIYHNGNKFRINSMTLLDTGTMQRKIKISKETGYAFLDKEAELANIDPINQSELKGDKVEIRKSLIELAECQGIPQERISCIEEERSSSGFEIEEYFRYTRGIEHTKKVLIKKGGESLLRLIYDQSTELIKVNRKLRRAQEEGFYIDRRNGKWLTKKDQENAETSENKREAMPFVRDSADTLYIQPLSVLNLNPAQIISLSYALKRGIERLFQVEESEIGVQVMGNRSNPNILIYEASEGSLGILSQLILEPAKLKKLFAESYRCMHFDPDTREETDLGKSLPHASYQDLLSYYNQREHEILNRYDIRQALETLMDCDYEVAHGNVDQATQYQRLLKAYDTSSSMEKKLLDFLYENKLALPDKAQVNMPEFYISADFVYNTDNGPVLIFCDGSVHDSSEQKAKDEQKRNLLHNAGYDVIVWHYSENIRDMVNRRKEVFKAVG